MVLFLILIFTSFLEVSHSGMIRVFHKLVKRPTISEIDSKQYALSNLRRIINALGALEDNVLKNDHPLSIPLPSMNPVKFYRQDSHKSLPNFPVSCVVALGRHKNEIFHRSFHLLSFAIPPSKWYPVFLCTQSW